jgi:DNA replication initiation complex subunit (GINS family)
LTDHYTRLLEWRRAESSARGLAKLPHDFYSSTQAYLGEARATFESELRSNPAGKKGEVARQTFQRASQIARDIVEARMMKILNLGFQASVGGSRELPNALAEERTLYDHLIETLRSHRLAVAPFLDPGAPVTPGSVAPPIAPIVPAASGSHSSSSSAAPRPESTFVRILKDGRPIEVGGETIELRKEDLLTLPPETARLLIEAKVAERVEVAPVT